MIKVTVVKPLEPPAVVVTVGPTAVIVDGMVTVVVVVEAGLTEAQLLGMMLGPGFVTVMVWIAGMELAENADGDTVTVVGMGQVEPLALVVTVMVDGAPAACDWVCVMVTVVGGPVAV